MHSILLINPFDAVAGSQRIAVNIVRALRTIECKLDVRLGFGSDGFLSRCSGVKRFLPTNNIKVRKFLYPLWLLILVPRVFISVISGEVVWANTIYAAPAAFLAVLFSPRRVIIHVHELDFPIIFTAFLSFAVHRGANLLCVSDFHRRELGLKAVILPNSVSVTHDELVHQHQNRLVFVGNTSAEKGFSLFIEVVRCLSGCDLIPVAFFPSQEHCDTTLLLQAESVGIAVRYGVTDPNEMYEGGFLSLLCSDPELWRETFSLVSVESMCCLVPVASAGTKVVREILGNAFAFDVSSRDPVEIASEIRKLQLNTKRHEDLVLACRARRGEYMFEHFQQRVQTLIKNLWESYQSK